MRRYITTEKKRNALDKLWRKYDRAVHRLANCHDSQHGPLYREVWDSVVDLRAQIEDFVYDNGGTLE